MPGTGPLRRSSGPARKKAIVGKSRVEANRLQRPAFVFLALVIIGCMFSDLNLVLLLQEALDLAHRHPLGVHGDNPLIKAAKAPLPLRIKLPSAIPRHNEDGTVKVSRNIKDVEAGIRWALKKGATRMRFQYDESQSEKDLMQHVKTDPPQTMLCKKPAAENIQQFTPFRAAGRTR